jgi:hypothetical protein
MMSVIGAIPADNDGNKLFIKELRKDGERLFLKYRSTFNDYPFVETEIFNDENKNVVIAGDDGTVLWRFSIEWLTKIELI